MICLDSEIVAQATEPEKSFQEIQEEITVRFYIYRLKGYSLRNLDRRILKKRTKLLVKYTNKFQE